MAERRVNVRLDGNSRGYVRSAKEAADATDDLRRKAERFAGRSYDAKAGVKGTAKAEEEVRRLEERLNRLQHTYTARVNMQSRGAQRDVALIMNSIAALGPAAVTAAAGASGALLAIGSTASTVAGGLGVLVLGFYGVFDAVQKMQKYALDPTKENLDNLNDSMKELSKSGQTFAKYLFSLKPVLQELRKTAQDGLLPGVQEGLEEFQVALPAVNGMIDKLSRALGHVATEAGAAFSSPFWQNFFDFIGREAGPTFDKLFSAMEKVARGIAAMQMAFSPMAQEFLTGLDQMASKFANWAQNLSSQGSGLQGFVDYLRQIGPTLLDFVGSVGNMLAQLAKAMAPVGPVVIKILEGIADAIAAVASVPGVGTTLVTIAAAMGALNLALRGMEIAKFSRLGQALGSLPSMTNKAALGAGVLTERFTGSANAGEKVASAGSKVGSALSKVGKALPVVGVAAVALAVGFDELADKSDDFAQNVIDGSSTMQQAINDERNSIEKRNFWLGDTTDNLDNEAEARQNLTEKIRENLDKLQGEARARGEAQVAFAEYNQAVHEFGSGSQQAIDAQHRLSDATNRAKDAQRDAAAATRDASAALREQQDQALAASSADLGYQQALANRKKAVDAVTTATRTHGAASDEARDANMQLWASDLEVISASDKLADSNLANASATDQSRLAAFNHENTLLGLASGIRGQASPAIVDMANKMTDSQLAAHNAMVETSGFDFTVRHLPDGRIVKIATDSAVREAENTAALIKKLNDLPLIKDIKITGTGTYMLGDGTVGGGARNSAGGTFHSPGISSATGGILPGFTPGRDVHYFQSPTAGSLNLSGGEAIMRPEWTKVMGPGYVNAANAAARHGGVQGVLGFLGRTIARPGEGKRGDAARFAAGGIYESPRWPQMVTDMENDIYKKAAADFEAQAKKAAQAGLWGGGSGAAGALAWARTQVGKPYVWGGVGPGGYDCSGFISAILNVAQGRPIYSRRGATGSMPWPGMLPGFGPGVNIGWSRDTGGGIGHTAGTIMGVNVESAGGVGVRVGGPVGASSSMFPNKAHVLADRGGILHHGDQAWNLSGKDERVLDPFQTDRFDRLVDVLDRPRPVAVGAGGGPATVEKHFHLTVQSAGNSRVDLEAQFKRLEAMAGV